LKSYVRLSTVWSAFNVRVFCHSSNDNGYDKDKIREHLTCIGKLTKQAQSNIRYQKRIILITITCNFHSSNWQNQAQFKA